MGINDLTCAAPGTEWLPRIIGAIGRADFPPVMFEALSEAFGVDHLVISILRRRGRIGTMATIGRIAPQLPE